MFREPFASSSKDTESALSDDELDGVVGGRGGILGAPVCQHGRTSNHNIPPAQGGGTCSGPFNQ
jgi:hypothetical protein